MTTMFRYTLPVQQTGWSVDLDPDNPMGLDDRIVQIHGSDIWDRLIESKLRSGHHGIGPMRQLRWLFTRIPDGGGV